MDMLDPRLDDYLVYKGAGIGQVRQRFELEGEDGEQIPAVGLEVIRFTGRPAGEDTIADGGVSYAIPLNRENRARLRGPMPVEDFFLLLRHMASGEAHHISKKELLSHSFSLDFFEPKEGARQAVVLHDYIFHNALDGRPSCSEYADLYRHGISSVAFEVSSAGGLDDRVARLVMEAALFVGHQMRPCGSCERRDPELLHNLNAYTAVARQWVRGTIRDGQLRPFPRSLKDAPIFLDPKPLPYA